MSTPHIEVDDRSKVAATVLMPGDPLRAEYIALNYLENPEKINGVRNMLGYTGFYKGKKITVMGSGMGMPSIGIYSYELFKFYDVDNIIRIGSCGSYRRELKLYDLILVKSAYSETTYASVAYGYPEKIMKSDEKLTDALQETADRLGYPLFSAVIHSSDVFYHEYGNVFEDVVSRYGCAGVEMEAFALFANARKLGKRAACLLTVSDSLVTGEVTTSGERQTSFHRMMETALETALKL